MSASSESSGERELRESSVFEESLERVQGIDLTDSRDRTPVSKSEIGFVDGSIRAGSNVAVRESDLGLVRGDVNGTERLFSRVNGAKVFGDMETEKFSRSRNTFESMVFQDSHLNTVIGDSVEGDYLADNSHGNLVVADRISSRNPSGNNLMIARSGGHSTPEDATVFEGENNYAFQEFNEFKQELKKRADGIEALPLLNPDLDTVTRDEFFELERELSTIVDEEIGDVRGRENELGEAMTALRKFNKFDNERLYARTLNTLTEASEEQISDVSSFTNKFRFMDGLREDFLQRFEYGESVGEDLLEVSDAVIPEGGTDFYSRVFKEEIKTLLNGWETPDAEYLKEDWEDSAFSEGYVSKGGMLENAYEELEEEVREIYTLAEFLDRDFEFDTEQWVKEQIRKDENGEETEIDSPGDVEEKLREELEGLQQKKYEWTKEALESLGDYTVIEGLNNEVGFALRTTETDTGQRMIEFAGDESGWEEFAEQMEENEHYGIHLLRPDIEGTVESYSEIQELEEEMGEIVESRIGDLDSIVDSGSDFRTEGILAYTRTFTDQDEELYAQVIAEALENEEVRQGIGDFGDLLEELDEGQRDKILEEIYGEDFGEELGQLADSLNYEDFVNSDTEEVKQLVNGRKPLEQDIEGLDKDLKDRLENLNYLSTLLEKDLGIDPDEASEEELRSIAEEREEVLLEAIEQVGNYSRVEELGTELNFSPFQNDTERGETLTEFEGDDDEWSMFQRELEENSESYRGLFALDPEMESVEGLEELKEKDDQMWSLIEQEYGSEEGLVGRLEENIGYVNSFPDLPARINSQILGRVLEMPHEDDTNKKRVKDFGSTLESLDEETREELYSLLASEGDEELLDGEGYGLNAEYSSDSKLGRQLANIGRAREYVNFLDGREKEAIEEILEGRKEDPVDVSEQLREEKPEWADRLEEIYERHEEDIAQVAYLSDFVDENFNYDEVEKSKLLNWAFNPNNDKDDIDWNSLEEEVVEKIENQKRSKMETALREVGKEGVKEEYEEAMGERPESVDELTDNELAALRIRRDKAKYDDDLKQVADTFLSEKDEVYNREDNQEWMQEHGFSATELQDPDLSDLADDEFKASDLELDSALTVEVREEERQYDEEAEKRKRWKDIYQDLENLGLDEVEGLDVEGLDQDQHSIELAENVYEEIDRNELDEDEQQVYDELKDDIRQFYGVEDMSGAVPDELDIVVSPVEDTVRMGHGFDSCLDYDGGSNNYSALTNAVDANKFAMYALDDEGNERARVKAAITDDEEMIYFNTSKYKDIQVDTSRHFEGYMERLADHWGLEDVKHATELEERPHEQVPTLVADDWYGKA